MLEVITPTGHLTSADFPTRKAKQVFEVLALSLGRTVSKDALIDLLWRRKWPQNPTATVELAVSLLRTALAKVTDERVVVTEPGGYRLNTSVAVIDLMTFDDLVASAGRRPEVERLGLLREAAAVVRGPLLDDEIGADWLQPYRDRYHQRVEAAQLGLARLALAHGDATLAHSVAEQAWSASEFVLEEAYAVGVAALLQLGRRTEARALMGRAEQRLMDEEGRTASPELLNLRLMLQEAVVPSRLHTAVKVDPAFAGAPATLPFLGRTAELAMLETFIARTLEAGGSSGSRLVCGPAGVGKSRLLSEVVLRASNTRKVHAIQCLASDRDHPMLAVGRLMRAIASDAKLRKQPIIDEGVTAMFGRLARMLDGLGPTLLVVDDLHLADASSMAVLRSLVGPGGAAQLCLLVSGPKTMGGPFDEETILLSALSAEDMEPLSIDTAWSETGGHPGTLAACCAAGSGSGELDDAELRSVRARLDGLGPLAPLMLSAASTLSTSFMAAEVALAVGLGLDVVKEVLHNATEQGVLRASGDDRFEFTGQLIRRLLAAEASISP